MKILLIDDDAELATNLAEKLDAAGKTLEIEHEGRAGLRRAETEGFDVVIVDCMLPDMHGVDLVRDLRTSGESCPVLILTALGAIEDRVRGLRAGADDYLVKPFVFDELAARIDALARRGSAVIGDTLAVGTVKIDRIRRDVWREGRRIVLQAREFEILERLMRQPDMVVSRAMLLEHVWHIHFDPQTNIVETHMSRLRQKLNAGFNDDLIRTIRGVGYMFQSDA
ncbi:response regulator transcription factor [Henriciella aquimarina]|uniref:response regulator transcription factor n=1 Tax=Henriciella aquimarina TaxID=545261 RepID=UPI0009FF9FEF|nr:response regulator transcription factor [Henriciella aquimarina]